MVRSIDAREAEVLIAGGDLDVVDVREPQEWESGHIPGARLVPLARLRDDPDGAALGPRVLFVCARGVRSASAADLAEGLGVAEVYSLVGGTAAWAIAGLPLEREASRDDAAEEASLPADGGAELEAVVGANLRTLRTQRGLTLDQLAGLSGVGRQNLGQIELGRLVPSLGTVWRIARAFDVPFSALLARPSTSATTVLRQKSASRIVSTDGRFSSRALFPPGDDDDVEFYELWLAPHGREDAEAHALGTRENLVVTAGRLVLEIDKKSYELAKGDAIVFSADVPHSYVNRSSEDCWINLVMTYRTRR